MLDDVARFEKTIVAQEQQIRYVKHKTKYRAV